MKTGKSFILPPVAGTILGPKYCDDGYHAPSDTNIGSPYDAPPPPRDSYEEPDVVAPPPRDTYEEPKDNYEDPDPNYKVIAIVFLLTQSLALRCRVCILAEWFSRKR